MTHLAALSSAARYVAVELHLYIDLQYVKMGCLLEISNMEETSTRAANSFDAAADVVV
jgi:hypothetical protein